METNQIKLPLVWAVGEEVLEKAQEIAEKVVLIQKDTAEEIARKATKENPEVILFGSDNWARTSAPIVAAKLKTGLCAVSSPVRLNVKTLYK